MTGDALSSTSSIVWGYRILGWRSTVSELLPAPGPNAPSSQAMLISNYCSVPIMPACGLNK